MRNHSKLFSKNYLIMKHFFLMLLVFVGNCVAANAQYTLTGKIEFERKVNVHAGLTDDDDDDDKEWIERMKKTIPKFGITYFDLCFDTTHSIYKPGREVEENAKSNWWDNPARDNIVITDFTTQKVKAKKNVFEQKFLVQDTMRKIDWKVKDELRTIANFKCHKAVGRICDSIYVVAFYTEDIAVSGGPEMFGGLPGMIMELAIPRLHTTWTATKVDLAPPPAKEYAVPDKGKKVTEKELYETIQNSLKDWGKWANKNVWWTVL